MMRNKVGFEAILDRIGKSKSNQNKTVEDKSISNKSIESHAHLLQEIHDTYIKKNSDYGDSFNSTIKEWGYIPAIARIEDKVRRIANIIKGNKMNYNEESLRDNLLDIANYCIMTIMSLDEKE